MVVSAIIFQSLDYFVSANTRLFSTPLKATVKFQIERVKNLITDRKHGPMPTRRRLHLYEPYFGEGEVHGLGLWVAYQRVTQLGGITVESVPGHTVFSVHIPLESPDAP